MLTRILLCLSLAATPAMAQDGVAVGDIVQGPLDIAAPALAAYEYFGEGRPMMNIGVAPNDAGLLEVRIEEAGLLDDAVEAIRTTFTLSPAANGGWRIETLTFHQRCARGDDRDWTTQACP